MARFVSTRLIQMIIVVLILTVICFLLIHLIPGDPVLQVLGPHFSQAQYNLVKHQLGLDQSISVQYFHWVWGILHGDFGKSFIYAEYVADDLKQRLPVTGYLSFWALLLSSIVGLVLGIVCATERGSIWDTLISLFANNAVAIPSFFLAILGIYFFGLKLGWLPIQGWISPTVDFWQNTIHIVMPVIALAIPNTAIITRQTRSSMMETIHQDYIRTAHSKGLSKRIVLYKHALRNALIPIVTVTGVSVTFLIGGEVMIETIFGIPGIGRLLVRAALEKDYLIIQGVVLVVGTIVCVVNLLVDITYSYIDPRIRYR